MLVLFAGPNRRYAHLVYEPEVEDALVLVSIT